MSLQTVGRMIRDRRLVAVRFPNRFVRITRASVAASEAAADPITISKEETR